MYFNVRSFHLYLFNFIIYEIRISNILNLINQLEVEWILNTFCNLAQIMLDSEKNYLTYRREVCMC